MARSLGEIGREIRDDWKAVQGNTRQGTNPNHPAGAYVGPMIELGDGDINARYYHDDARGIVRYFLANATSWRGDTARRVKAELKSMLK